MGLGYVVADVVEEGKFEELNIIARNFEKWVYKGV